ncbi:MAG TPA: hypothetical protein VKE69_10310 [Planctomycetota bacterium]|nr:hypothetical protein [Planctomycetota bacterium]
MRLSSTLVLLLVAASTSSAQSPPPNQLHFQARLSNAAGAPLAGPVSLTVRVYDVPVGGSPLWSETQALTPIDGIATLALGSVTPLPPTLFDGATRWLALQVAPDAEMTPRRAIVPVPFAARAAKAAALDANATIPASVVTTTQVLDGTIAAADLANAAVTTAKIAAGAITSGKLASNSVTASAIASGAVGSAEIADGTISLADVANPLVSSLPGAALAVTTSGADGIAVSGEATATTGATFGVRGESSATSGAGVLGSTDASGANAAGVRGETSGGQGAGVVGRALATSGAGYGVFGEANGSGSAVVGWAHGNSNISHGIVGNAYGSDGSGVVGWSAHQSGVWGMGGNTGVKAEGTSYGLWAQGGFAGVNARATSTGTYAVIATQLATTGVGYGVLGQTQSPSGWGVYSDGKFGATGSKSFIQPHPTDPSREIHFTCLEGNESGTYFRGTSKVVGGVAIVDVPEEFRLVSEGSGLTVQLTAVGKLAVLCVESSDLRRIVVRGSEDVEFSYFVNGVRRGFAKHEWSHTNTSFVPRERGVPFGTQYPEALRRILVENGILNADFTPNEETAARLGWDLRDPEPANVRDGR